MKLSHMPKATQLGAESQPMGLLACLLFSWEGMGQGGGTERKGAPAHWPSDLVPGTF